MTRKWEICYGKETHKLFCPRNKITGEFVDERYNLTRDIFEAIGWGTKELCEKDIQDFDEPEEWEVAIKFVDMIIGKLLE